MNFGVVIFPGTWSDCDFHYVISEVLHQPVRYVWHRDANGVWRVLFDNGAGRRPADEAAVQAFHAGRQAACPQG